VFFATFAIRQLVDFATFAVYFFTFLDNLGWREKKKLYRSASNQNKNRQTKKTAQWKIRH